MKYTPRLLFVGKTQKYLRIKDVLTGKGYDILNATNGLKLISYLEMNTPDLILMDTKSLWPNSFSLCEKLKQGKYKNIPVFFISNNSDKEESKRSYKCGCTHYFCEKNHEENLYKKINEVVETTH
jgi:response regulator RpfG family c-di-GMP phosphodiesterase